MSGLVFAVPSKGRLQEQTLAFFQDCGLAIAQTGGQRGYVARIAALPDVEVRLLSASDIAAGLRDGELHVGVTGEDLLRELGPAFSRIVLARALGFGRADLVVAVPAAWLDVASMADLDAVSERHREQTGRRLRVATKYIRQAHAFFDARGVEDYRIVESLGATEGAPAAGTAEVIVDITTTGSTLAANHLKVLGDGLILRSEAQIAASRAANWTPEALSAMALMLDQIEARALGKACRLVRAPLGEAKVEALDRVFQEAGCSRAGDGMADGFAYYCALDRLSAVCAAAAAAGAGPIGIFAPEYIFERSGRSSKAFLAQLSA